MQITVDRLRNWVARFGLELIGDPDIDEPEHRGFHAGGHAPQEDIYRLMEIINPKLLIPIHTQYPDLMDATAAGGDAMRRQFLPDPAELDAAPEERGVELCSAD